MARVSGSENGFCPAKVSEQGLSDAPAAVKQYFKFCVIFVCFLNYEPIQKKSKLRLGSVPIHVEPGFGRRVFLHRRV